MKKSLRVISLLSMIFFTIASTPSIAKKKSEKTNGNNPAGITYIISITNSYGGGLCYSYYVVLKDEEGNPVDTPILFQEGIDNYVFHENGPVSGTRIAYLERSVVSNQYRCSQVLFTYPVQISGSFRNGSTYQFQLHPDMQAGHD